MEVALLWTWVIEHPDARAETTADDDEDDDKCDERFPRVRILRDDLPEAEKARDGEEHFDQQR